MMAWLEFIVERMSRNDQRVACRVAHHTAVSGEKNDKQTSEKFFNSLPQAKTKTHSSGSVSQKSESAWWLIY